MSPFLLLTSIFSKTSSNKTSPKCRICLVCNYRSSHTYSYHSFQNLYIQLFEPQKTNFSSTWLLIWQSCQQKKNGFIKPRCRCSESSKWPGLNHLWKFMFRKTFLTWSVVSRWRMIKFSRIILCVLLPKKCSLDWHSGQKILYDIYGPYTLAFIGKQTEGNVLIQCTPVSLSHIDACKSF